MAANAAGNVLPGFKSFQVYPSKGNTTCLNINNFIQYETSQVIDKIKRYSTQ